MARENGIVAIAKVAIPSGARIPVRTKTAAMGKKITPKGICRQSKPAINSFSGQGNVGLGEFVFDASMWFVSVTTHYVAVFERRSARPHFKSLPSLHRRYWTHGRTKRVGRRVRALRV
jgi:hypothetical protein